MNADRISRMNINDRDVQVSVTMMMDDLDDSLYSNQLLGSNTLHSNYITFLNVIQLINYSISVVILLVRIKM